jgi:hypothetical protein
MTLEEHLEDMKTLRNLAVKHKQMGPAVAAEQGRAKAAGLAFLHSPAALDWDNL